MRSQRRVVGRAPSDRSWSALDAVCSAGLGRHLRPGPVLLALGLSALGLSALGLSACGPTSSDPGGEPGGVAASGQAEADGPRLVLLYATCSLNRAFLGPYGADPRLTPAITDFARGGSVFVRHLTESGQSGTAYAALWSGLHADGHGVYRHPTPLDPSVPTILEHFREAGWDTLAWLEHEMASAELGFARGARRSFDHKLEAPDPVFLEVLERLRTEPDYRALIVTNFTVTHGPYRPDALRDFCPRHPEYCRIRDEDPEAFARYVDLYGRSHAHLSYDLEATRERMAMGDEHFAALREIIELLYRANVSRLDGLFGRVIGAIAAAGLGEASLVALTADHGEILYREDALFHWTHGHQLAQEVLTVPWILVGPGVTVGTYPQSSSSVDVFPTLAAFARVPPPRLEDSAQVGVDLSQAVRDRVPAPQLESYSHTALVAEAVVEASRRWGRFHRFVPRVDPELMWVQLVRDGWLVQLRRGPTDGEALGLFEPRVYELGPDPDARTDLSGELLEGPPIGKRRQAAHLDLRKLEAYRQRLVAGWDRWSDRPDDLDLGRQEELLRSLGYVSD